MRGHLRSLFDRAAEDVFGFLARMARDGRDLALEVAQKAA
jgi:hypothetical protein